MISSRASRFWLLLAWSVWFCGDHREPAHANKVLLVPIGPVPRELLTYLQQELPPLVQREIVIGGTIAPADAFDAERKQFLGSAFLEQLKRQPAGDADRVIGIIDADLYAPGLNFIFGQARLPGRVAVVAIPRLRERERVLKVATHELGHAYGFRHCDDTSCVMHFANSVRELDRSGRTYCARERIPR